MPLLITDTTIISSELAVMAPNIILPNTKGILLEATQLDISRVPPNALILGDEEPLTFGDEEYIQTAAP